MIGLPSDFVPKIWDKNPKDIFEIYNEHLLKQERERLIKEVEKIDLSGCLECGGGYDQIQEVLKILKTKG